MLKNVDYSNFISVINGAPINESYVSLDIRGEDLKGVETAHTFLKRVNYSKLTLDDLRNCL